MDNQQKNLRHIGELIFLFNMLIFPFIPRQNRIKSSVEWNGINKESIWFDSQL